MVANPPEKHGSLVSDVDQAFDQIPYSDPLFFESKTRLADRSRHRLAIDPETRQVWIALDSLSVHEDTSSIDVGITAVRTVVLFRGLGEDQLYLVLDVDEDKVSVGGLGEAMFEGEPDREFATGIRVILEHGL